MQVLRRVAVPPPHLWDGAFLCTFTSLHTLSLLDADRLSAEHLTGLLAELPPTLSRLELGLRSPVVVRLDLHDAQHTSMDRAYSEGGPVATSATATHHTQAGPRLG